MEQRLLQNCYTELYDRLERGEIESYVWLIMDDMAADILTKDSKENLDRVDITRDNRFRLSRNEDNIVSYSDGEITLRNRKEKAKKRENIEFENDEGLKLEVN